MRQTNKLLTMNVSGDFGIGMMSLWGQGKPLPYLRVELLVEVSGLLLSLDEVQHLPAARGEERVSDNGSQVPCAPKV